nr:prepilin peptidase [Propionicimonas sp.]
MAWIATAAIAGSMIGATLALQLRALGYRRMDEQALPAPRTAWWLAPAVGLSWAWLTWHLQGRAWPVLALWLPLSAALGWLSAVDLDVSRLPDAVLRPTAGWLALTLIAHGIITGSALSSLVPAAIGVVVGIAAWVFHHVSRGAFGFGDVKLVAVLSAAVAIVSPSLVLPALFASCLVAIAVALVTRRREFAFGPSLAVGCVLAVGLASLT